MVAKRLEGTQAVVQPDGTDIVIDCPAASVLAVCRTLRHDPDILCDYPADLFAFDNGSVIGLRYRLTSMTHDFDALLRVELPLEAPAVASVTAVWPGMDWHERECFDLFGVAFEGHPDMDDPSRMRLLLPEDWVGHPFRRDYKPVFAGDPLNGPQETN